MKRLIPAIALIAALALPGFAAAQENGYLVVAHASSTPDSIAKRDLARLFLKKKKKWPNGQTVQPVDNKGNEAVRTRFSEEVLRKSLEMVESHWQAQVFSGKGTPPKSMRSDANVIAYVRSNPGAVGYVSAGADITGVKIVTITN